MTIAAPATTTPIAPALLTTIRATIESNRERLIELSHAIHADPELAFAEHRAAARVADLLESSGFDVTRGAYGLDTAVVAQFGTGEVNVAVVGEYDALPGIGHGCGHNLIAAAGVGAALALQSVADEAGITVTFLGSPAEELGGGKVLMLQQGAWDDATFSLMVHGAPLGQLRTVGFATTALEEIVATFTGRASHAAAMPHEGINAADGVTLTQVGIGLLRQQLQKEIVVSTMVTNGGLATNVIHEHSEIALVIRGSSTEVWNEARRRVRAVIEGAAMATGCTVEIRQTEEPYAPMQQHDELARIFDTILEKELGYELGDVPQGLTGGSTDMGNVSAYLPSIHPMMSVEVAGAVPHHESFTAAAATPAGDTAAIDGALALALTAVTASTDEGLRARLLEAQRQRAPFATPE